MPYIGRDAQTAQSQNKIIDDISSSFNGSTTSFALLVGGVAPAPFPATSQNLLISVGGVIQEPDGTGTNGYQLTGANIVFSAAPASGQSFFGVVLAGADYVNAGANFPDGDAGTPSITFSQDLDTGLFRSGSGTTSFTSNNNRIADFGTAEIVFNEDGDNIDFRVEGDNEANLLIVDAGSDAVLLGGTTTASSLNGVGSTHKLVVAGSTSDTDITDNSSAAITISNKDGTANNTAGLHFAREDTDETPHYCGASVVAQFKETQVTGQYPKADLAFLTSTAANNAPSEKMRLLASGELCVGTTSNLVFSSNTEPGVVLDDIGAVQIARQNEASLFVNRQGNDGVLVAFYQAGNFEGDISVSGTTVSYNGGHLSRWSQLAGGVERVEILRGSVLSNLDEMCEWGDEDNEQLNRMEVSTVEGDPNVAGVFQAWDDDDDVYTNDFYCAMTGDFVIRIAQGTTVARGDLLMSAGDGTAKPQDDDIVRSKTIAKVTSTVVSETYADGSYCVPCVLMAC